ncbi:MAG TPA: hypothetical protein V6D17_18615 [Candidatus Obscuribacterales bacterium]
MIFDAALAGRQPVATLLIGNAVLRGRLAHAYLLVGRNIDDKWLLAKELAAFLNCSREDKTSLGSCLRSPFDGNLCRDCKWISDEAHPQAWHRLGWEGKTTARKISVASARALGEEMAKTSSAFRMVIVEDAEQDVFHRPAANALLKTIEEPPPQCIFVLFADYQDKVLPTVVSRCQQVPVVKIPYQDVFESDWPEMSLTAAFQAAGWKKGRLKLEAIEFAKRLGDEAERLDEDSEEIPLLRVIDHAVAGEIRRLKASAAKSERAAQYIAKLLDIAERAKAEAEHYVSARALLESFAFCWTELAESYQHDVLKTQR